LFQINGKELFFSLNPTTFEPEFVLATKNIAYNYNGKILRIKNRSFDLGTTDNHNHFVNIRKRGLSRSDTEWEFRKSTKLPTEFKIPRGINWVGVNKEIVIGNNKFSAEQFSRFMGYYLSEGYSRAESGNDWVIVCQSDEVKKDKIYQDLLVDLPNVYGLKKISNGVTFKDAHLNKYLHQFGKSNQKFIPSEIKRFSSEAIRKFLDAFNFGDGWIVKGKIFNGHQFNDSKFYKTSSKRLADDLGELILKVGQYPSYSLVKCGGKEQKFNNGTYTINNDCWVIAENKRTTYHSKCEDLKWEDYDGMVYDVELEKNHILYVRYNGKCCWTGNCKELWKGRAPLIDVAYWEVLTGGINTEGGVIDVEHLASTIETS